MREIKYEAWIDEENRMGQIEEIIFYKDEDTKGGEIFIKGDRHSYYFPEQAKLRQFTGLKDKKGKEIWEGDIILLGTDRKVVTREPLRAGWLGNGGNNNHGYGLSEGYKDSMEVVGNIYENPELLED